MSLRVVLADDHVVLRQGVRALLERHGLEVVAEASDGRAAGGVAREGEPDVAGLGIMMPLLNGVGAARQSVQAWPRPPGGVLFWLPRGRRVAGPGRARRRWV